MKTIQHKITDAVSIKSLVLNRNWKEDLIPIYLTKIPCSAGYYKKSELIKIENYLTKMGIDFKVSN
jgi:hypothetical protein